MNSEPGESILLALHDSARFLDDFRGTLRAELRTSAREASSSTESGANLITILDIAPHLPNRDYRALVGLLNEFRKSNDRQLLSALNEMSATKTYSKQLLLIVDEFRDLYERYMPKSAGSLAEAGSAIDSRHELKAFDSDFASQAMELTRMIYPFGVNIINPTWDGKAPASVSIAKTIKLTINPNFDAEYISIAPNRFSGCSYVSLQDVGKSGNGKNGDALGKESDIKLMDGQAIIIGRQLSTKNLFGIDIPKIMLPVRELVGNDYARWSRGGVMIARQNDEIYIFDRGSRNPLRFEFGSAADNLVTGIFSPEATGNGDDSAWDFGKSRIFRPDSPQK